MPGENWHSDFIFDRIVSSSQVLIRTTTPAYSILKILLQFKHICDTMAYFFYVTLLSAVFLGGEIHFQILFQIFFEICKHEGTRV